MSVASIFVISSNGHEGPFANWWDRRRRLRSALLTRYSGTIDVNPFGNEHRAKLWALGAGTAALALTALYNHSRSRRAEAASPPAGRFITVDGVQLHYVDHGQGRPVVLLHGNGAMIQDWEASGVLPRAAERYRVIAFDRPGFGYSERPRTTIWTPAAQAALLHKALEQLGVDRPIVIGHSWGTLVAVAMALDAPAGVSALVLLSGYYHPTLRADTLLGSPPAVPVIGDVLRHTVSPIIGRMSTASVAKMLFAPSPVAASFARFPVEMALRPSQIRAAAADTALMVPSAANLSRRYGDLKLPVIILAGDGDKVSNFHRQSEALHARVPHSLITRIPNAGHMIHHIVPDRVLEAIDLAVAKSGGAANGSETRPRHFPTQVLRSEARSNAPSP